MSWITDHYFELIAAALGFVSIYLQIRQHVWYWPVSIVMVFMYIFVYIDARLYADMSLQFYYLAVSIYGWYLWAFGVKVMNHSEKITVTRTSPSLLLILLLIACVLFFLIGWILDTYTNSDLPYWDSFTTSLSFIATWMLARKKIENWIIWIIVDAVSAFIYLYKELYPTMILFTFLTMLAMVGYRKWRLDLAI